jgi:hypothetical protein
LDVVLFLVAGFICFVLLICIMKLHVHIDLLHAKDNDHFKVTLKTFFGLLRYTIDIPLVKIDKQSLGIVVSRSNDEIGNVQNNVDVQKKKYTPSEIVHSLQQTKRFIDDVIHLHSIIKKFMSHVSITKFEWHTRFGIGDAAYTGIAVGVGWSIKYGVITVLSKYMKLKTSPVFTIIPSFQQPTSQTKLACMIHFRIGYAMLAGMRIVKYWRGNSLEKLKAAAAHKVNESY